MNLIFDESGNWDRNTERYFVIGGYVTQNQYRIRAVMRRAVKDVREQFPSLSALPEIKANNCPSIAKDYIIRKLAKENIDIYYIVVDKNHLDYNLLESNYNRFYNYQLGLVARYIRSTNNFTELNFTIDNKSLKVGSLNSFEDYIAIKLNFGLRKQTYVSVKYLDSQHFFEIQAADFICNALWGRENYPNTDLYSPFIWRLVKKRLKFPITGFGK